MSTHPSIAAGWDAAHHGIAFPDRLRDIAGALADPALPAGPYWIGPARYIERHAGAVRLVECIPHAAGLHPLAPTVRRAGYRGNVTVAWWRSPAAMLSELLGEVSP